jgi:hypothetical protein
MSWRDNIENLVRIGQLKRADFVGEDVAQYFGDASGYLTDAKVVASPQARFLLAYEGIHALSMGVLNKAEVRVDSGEGHRQTALQAALMIVDVNARVPGSSTVIMGIHRMRNTKTYHSPLPPVSASQADAAVKALDLMLDAASAFLNIPRK